MKVLFLSQIVPYPSHGGVLQRGFNILRELGRTCEVHLVAFLHPDELPTPESQAEAKTALSAHCARVEFHPLWAKASRLHKVAALATGIASRQPFSVVAHRSASFNRAVRNALDGGTCDVVHVDTIALSAFVPDHMPLPSVLTHHNIESKLMERRADRESSPMARMALRRESSKLRRYEARMAPRFDVNVTMSPVDEAILRDLAPTAATAVVPNGVDIDYFNPAPDPESPVMIYTGGMNMFANRDAVLHFRNDIWPLIAARVPDARFVAVGQDPPPELRAWAASDQRIEVTGKVPDIRPHVARAAVYVVPLRVGGGTRLKVLDAMASGKAIVSTSIGCEGIEAEDGRDLLMADTPRAFAETVVSLLQDSGRRQELGRNARALVEARYTWAAIGKRLADAYDIAAARHRERAS